MTKRPWTDNVYFILVAPTEPGNIGAAARAVPPLVGSRDIQELMKRIRATLDVLGYGKKGDRDLRADILRNVRRLIGRAGLTEWELGMIHGLCRRVEDKVRREKTLAPGSVNEPAV